MTPFKTRIRGFADQQLEHSLRGLNHWITRLEGARSPWLRQTAVPALLALRRRGLRLISRRNRYVIHRCAGIGRQTGQPLRMVSIAEGKSLAWLLEQIYGPDGAAPERLGSCHTREVPERAAGLAAEADLVVVEGDTAWQPAHGAWMRVPVWVAMRFHFTPGEPWDAVLQRMDGQRKNIKKVLKHGFSVRVSHAEEDYQHFYHHMHVPLVAARHRTGSPDSEDSLRWYFQHGFLLLAETAEGQAVAGDVCMINGDTFYSFSTGVLDGDFRWIDLGAQSALYYHTFRQCWERGLRAWDVGNCRPFLNDGIFVYKSRWGFRPYADAWQPRSWVFWAPHGAGPGLDWLAANPVVPELAQCGRAGRP